MVNEHEITCIIEDNDGNITHMGFKKEGIHSVLIITRLIIEGSNSFYIYKNGDKMMVDTIKTPDYNKPLNTDPVAIDIDDLYFLPRCILPDPI